MTTTVVISRHAVERFNERVRPSLSRRDARHELELLCVVCGVFGDRPDWMAFEHVDCDGWLLLGPDIALPVKNSVVTTCVTRMVPVERVDNRRLARRGRRLLTRARSSRVTPRSSRVARKATRQAPPPIDVEEIAS